MITQNPFEIAEKNLKRYLLSLERKSSLKILWEINRLVSEKHPENSKSKIIYNLPASGISNVPNGGPYVTYWQLEQAANLISIFSKDYSPKRGFFDFRDWHRISDLFVLMNRYNEAASGKFLKTDDVFVSLARIGAQQMIWQDGSMGGNALARYAYIYSGNECSKLCNSKFELDAQDFFSYGLILLSQFHRNCHLNIPYDMEVIGGENSKLKKILNLFSISMRDLTSKSRS
jgi:hypothetical protein